MNKDYTLKTHDILAICGAGYKTTVRMIYDNVVNETSLETNMTEQDIRRRNYGRKLEDDMKVTMHEIPYVAQKYPNFKDGLVRGREYYNKELKTAVKPNYQNDELGIVIDVSVMNDRVFDYLVVDGVCPKHLEVKVKILMYFQAVKRFKSAMVVVAVGNYPPEHVWEFPYDEAECAFYRSKVEAFHKRIENDDVPEFSENDVEFYKSARKNEVITLNEDKAKEFETVSEQYIALKVDYDKVNKETSALKKQMDELKTRLLVVTENNPFVGELLTLAFSNPKLSFNTDAFLAHVAKKYSLNYSELVLLKAKTDNLAFGMLAEEIAKLADKPVETIRAEIDDPECLRGVTPSASCKINKAGK